MPEIVGNIKFWLISRVEPILETQMPFASIGSFWTGFAWSLSRPGPSIALFHSNKSVDWSGDGADCGDRDFWTSGFVVPKGTSGYSVERFILVRWKPFSSKFRLQKRLFFLFSSGRVFWVRSQSQNRAPPVLVPDYDVSRANNRETEFLMGIF